MSMRTQDGRCFSRDRKRPAGQADKTARKDDSRGAAEQDGLEQEMSSMERQVGRLFEGSSPNKRKWDSARARAKASKWRKITEKMHASEAEWAGQSGLGDQLSEDRGSWEAARADSSQRGRGRQLK